MNSPQPVCVKFKLRAPVVISPTDKYLDALLSWAAVQRSEWLDEEDPWSAQHDIGIAKHHVGDQWCFMAGSLQYEWNSPPFQLHYIKRSKLEDYAGAWDAGLLKKIPYFDAASGRTKAGSYIQTLRWTDSVKAYAVIEDMERFEQLLPWVTAIGKLHHKGKGAVKSFVVAHDETANEVWSQRNLPSGSPFAIQHAPTIGGLKSPYWKRENHVELVGFAPV